MNAPIKYGIYYFLSNAAVISLQYVIDKESILHPVFGTVIPLGIAILFIVLAIKADRLDEPGYSFGEALKAGMICFGLGSFLLAIYNVILLYVIDPGFGDIANQLIKEMSENVVTSIFDLFGAPEDVKTEAMEELKTQELPNPYSPQMQLLDWLGGLIFPGVIASLIAAAILKRD